MRTLKTLCITLTATALLASAPAARAQAPEDLELMQTFLSIMTDYFGIIRSTHEVASDPEMAAIMQMQKIQEVYEQRGEKARSVEILREVLKESNNPTIRNAAYLMLGDTLKETGRSDDAIRALTEGLRENIRAAD